MEDCQFGGDLGPRGRAGPQENSGCWLYLVTHYWARDLLTQEPLCLLWVWEGMKGPTRQQCEATLAPLLPRARRLAQTRQCKLELAVQRLSAPTSSY